MAPPQRSRCWMYVLLAVWLVGVLAAFSALAAYQGEPGAVAQAGDWPVDSELVRECRPTVVLFLHPECACSRATLAELNRLLPRLRSQPDIRIVMSGVGDTLTSLAAKVVGARLHADPDATVARQFGATTSGHLFVYDAGGGLWFHGGITRARAHEGPNDGVEAVLTHLGGDHDTARSTPVFGCPLYDAEPVNDT